MYVTLKSEEKKYGFPRPNIYIFSVYFTAWAMEENIKLFGDGVPIRNIYPNFFNSDFLYYTTILL